MDDLTDSRHTNRLEIVNTGRRRRWSAAEKLRIVEESFSAPRLASAMARRHGISNQLLFAWRKAYREGRLGDIVGFVPAVMVPEQPEKKGTGADCRRIEIVITNGRRVIVDCDVDVETLLRIMRGLETLP
ncbi:MAG: transposase [Xanthobacteraceae bacterium]